MLDTEKIRQSQQRNDGFLCIACRAKDLTHEQVLDHYHHLFQIELGVKRIAFEPSSLTWKPALCFTGPIRA